MDQNFLKIGKLFLFYSLMDEWLTWQWVVLDFSQLFWSFDTPKTPGSVSPVFAKNEIWNRLKQFLPVCIWISLHFQNYGRSIQTKKKVLIICTTSQNLKEAVYKEVNHLVFFFICYSKKLHLKLKLLAGIGHDRWQR